MDKSQPSPHTSSLLTRSSNKQHSFLQHESANPRTTGVRSPENIEFKLSPIHTCTTNTGSGLANRSLVSDENSSNLSSESVSSTSEAKCVSLTPLHAKQLTASDLFKSTPMGDRANHHKASTTSDGKHSTTTLSPLHATGSGVLKQPTDDLQSPERKPVVARSGSSSLAIGLSPVHTKLSSNHSRQLKHSSPTHKQRDGDSSLLLQLRDAEEDTRTKPDFPKAESPISSPKRHLGSVPDQYHQSVEQSVESKQEDIAVASPMKSFLEGDKSGLGEDLAELQSALQAAGLPPMAVKDEGTPKEEPTQSQSSQSPRAVSVGTKDAKIPQSSAPVDAKPKLLARFTRDNSESAGKQDPAKVSGKTESPGAMGFDLREAIRAIASEELTTISKEILKQKQTHSVSQLEQPLHETASASSDNQLERGTESLLPRREDEASHDTYEGLEKLSDLLADIEHDSETHKSTAKYENSRKPGHSSARKSASTLPKTGTKASASKEGLASKVDARLSSKVKANDRKSSAGKSSYRTSSRIAELAVPKKINKTPSATSIGSQAKSKHHPQTYRPSTSKSAPPRHPSSGRAGLKQYSGTAAKSASHQPSNSSRQHQIVIPTGSSSALESQSDSSEGEIIHVIHEGGRKTNDERPEVKMDAWKIALQEEKVGSFLIIPQFLDKGQKWAQG